MTDFLSSLIKARLEKDGFTVLQAFDGDEAIERFQTERPNLVVLDLIMPKANGFEVLKTISMTPGPRAYAGHHREQSRTGFRH